MMGPVEIDAVLGRLRGAAAPALSASLALYNGDPLSGGTELSGPGYARLGLSPSDWAAPADAGGGSRRLVSSGVLEFTAAAGASWGSATHWAVVDGGGVRWRGALPAPVSVVEGNRIIIPSGAIALQLGGPSVLPLIGTDAAVAFVGNSYTQNFGSVPASLQHYLDARLPANTTSLGPPPYMATTIGDDDGWYTAMTLGGMALFPTIDQRQQGNTGTTDAVDAILSAGPGAYDHVVLTSDFRRSEDLVPGEGIDYVVLTGAGGTNPSLYGVILEVVRRVATALNAGGAGAGVILRMTQEGYNVNQHTDLSNFERIVRIQVLGARQLESEGTVAFTLPDHYLWSRLTRGKIGTAGVGLEGPVPAYVGLTHANSLQPDGRNYAWLNRSQGDVAPFGRNGHQNAIATIVHAWAWGYALFGLDPRGDTTFSSPTGLPTPLNNMLRADGLRIYGGHNTGLGNRPYDTAPEWNPGGPPDSELDLDWSAATQLQIQERIVAALDDYYAHTTEFD